MRPLGRLAFVDHQDLIRTQREKAIDRAFKTAPVEAWKSASQPLFSLDTIDIVFVGSISGGGFHLRRNLLRIADGYDMDASFDSCSATSAALLFVDDADSRQ